MSEEIEFEAEKGGALNINKATYEATHDAAEADWLDDLGDIWTITNSYVAFFGYFVTRCELAWDTSELAEYGSIRITRAEVTLLLAQPAHGSETDAGQSVIHVVEGVQEGDPEASDFGDLLTKVTSGGQGPAYSEIEQVASEHTITLNAIGRGWINKSGITKLAFRLAGDINNEEPTGDNDVDIYTSEAPVLTIEFEAGRPGNPVIAQRMFQHAERMQRFR